MKASRAILDRNDAQAGFTLLELLVALVLMGLLSIAMFSGLHFGTAVWARSQQGIVRSTKIATVRAMLVNVIERSYPIELADGSESDLTFNGEASSLSFLASVSNRTGEMTRETFSVERSNGALSFIQSERPELAIDSTANGNARILLVNIQSVDFSYFGSKRGQTQPRWQSTWHDRGVLPELVRVRVVIRNTRAQVWPDLVIQPRVGGGADCIFDPLTKFCQGRS